jgi:Holliday junction DNA helicase RuvA
MIARLRGRVVEKEKNALIVEVGGVGYRVFVLSAWLGQVRVEEESLFLIHHHVSDEEESLYGFKDQESLKFFELLLKVPSVGVKTAMGILEIASPAILAQAVQTQDAKLLTNVRGIGKKTAQRILIELKEKIGEVSGEGVTGEVQQEVLEALMSIGFAKGEAREAVSKLSPTVKSVEEAVRLILQAKSK